MDDEIKEDVAIEEESVEETGGESSPEEEKAEEKEKSGKTKPAKPKKKSGKLKRIALIFILLLAAAAGASYFLFPDKFSFSTIIKSQPEDITIDEAGLMEEALAPFFIPPGPSSKTIRIDLTAVWDGLASIKYKKMELSARNMIYDKLYKMAGQTGDLNNHISTLENEISTLLRSTLDVRNLVIRIKEIRYF